MFSSEQWKKYERVVYAVFVTVMVYFFFRYISPLIAPFLVAFILVFFAHAALCALQKKFHIRKRSLAVILLIFLVFLTGAMVYLLVNAVRNQVQQLEVWYLEIQRLVEPFCDRCYSMMDGKFGIDRSQWEHYVSDNFSREWQTLQSRMMPQVLASSYQCVRSLLLGFGFLFVTVLATVLLMKEYGTILLALEKWDDLQFIRNILKGVLSYLVTFVRVQGILILMISSLCSLVLGLAGIKGFLFLGILAGILDVLPCIGTGTVLVPLSAWQFVQGNYAKVVVCLILYVVCIFIRELCEPKLIGDRVGIAPLYMILAIFAGIRLFGIIGIIKGPLGLIVILQLLKERKQIGQQDKKRTKGQEYSFKE